MYAARADKTRTVTNAPRQRLRTTLVCPLVVDSITGVGKLVGVGGIGLGVSVSSIGAGVLVSTGVEFLTRRFSTTEVRVDPSESETSRRRM